MWLLKFSILNALAISNSPWPADRFQLIPKMDVEFSPVQYFYIGQSSSARSIPLDIFRWGPATAEWVVMTGFRYPIKQKYNLEIELGHKSEHALKNKLNDPTESMDYLQISMEARL